MSAESVPCSAYRRQNKQNERKDGTSENTQNKLTKCPPDVLVRSLRHTTQYKRPGTVAATRFVPAAGMHHQRGAEMADAAAEMRGNLRLHTLQGASEHCWEAVP